MAVHETLHLATERTQPLQTLSRRLGFSRAEGTRVSAFYATIGLLHLGGWGLFLYYSSRHPALAGLGFVAYMLGLRHAFDDACGPRILHEEGDAALVHLLLWRHDTAGWSVGFHLRDFFAGRPEGS